MKLIDTDEKEKLIERIQSGSEEERKLPRVYAWMFTNVDFDYGSESPVRNLAYELSSASNDVKDGDKRISRISLYRERFGLPLVIGQDDYYEKEYNILKERHQFEFKSTNREINAYIKQLKSIGVKHYKDATEVEKAIAKQKDKNRNDAIEKGYHDHKYIGDDESIAKEFKSICDSLNIECELVKGFIANEQGYLDSRMWNIVWDQDGNTYQYDLTSAIKARDKGLNSWKYCGFNEDSFDKRERRIWNNEKEKVKNKTKKLERF